MKPRSAKAKGRRLQNWIAKRITDHIFDGYTVARPAIMGEPGEDIKVYPLWRKIFPWSIEAKNQESLNIWKALEQAEANAPRDTKPIVVFTRNRTGKYVAIRWEDFEEIASREALRVRGRWPSDAGSDEEGSDSEI